MKPSSNILASSNKQQGCQTLFAPEMQTGTTDVAFTFGINGSLRKVETHFPDHDMEHYLFNSAANLKAYGSDAMYYAYYGYNASNTRTYKLGLPFSFQWQNGQRVKVCIQPEQAMFYPNAYINFNQNGEYTKHYYNGTERICSRLGGQTVPIAVPDNALLRTRTTQAGQRFRSDIQNLDGSSTPVALYPISVDDLQPTGNTTDIYYYHTNHLGSTAFVTDQNRNITQGFLYAPFGEITTEYNANFGNNVLPKYTFNAKELDEETGMYYYEARYYKPPVFTSRDPMFEKYFWMTPYAYCANNPVKYVDPDGRDFVPKIDQENKTITICAKYYTSENNKDELQKALDVWNKQSNCYRYVIGKGKERQKYTIKFDLQIETFDTQENAEKAFNNDKTGMANYYDGRTYNGIHRGITTDGKFIKLNVDNNKIPNSNRTLAHEVGHTLGLSEWRDGLMESGGFQAWISKDYIFQMFSTAGFNPDIPMVSIGRSSPIPSEDHDTLWSGKKMKEIPSEFQNGIIRTVWP